MVVSCCTDEVPEPGQDRAAILGDLGEYGGGRQGCGGSGPPSGSLASQGFMAPAEGKRAREESSTSGPPSRTKPCLGGRGFNTDRPQRKRDAGTWDQHHAIGPGALSCWQRPCCPCSGRWSCSSPPPPICSLLPLGPRAPRVEADVPMQSSHCLPAHLGNYCLPSGGPAAAPRGKGCRGFFLVGGKRHGPVGTLRALRGSFVGPSGPTQLEKGAHGGPAVGTRLLTPSAG